MVEKKKETKEASDDLLVGGQPITDAKPLTIDEAKQRLKLGGDKARTFEEKVLEKQDGQFTKLMSIVFGWKLQKDGSKKLVSKMPSGKICHSAGTLILMKDLLWKPIEEVNVGDKVIGFDLIKKEEKTNAYYTISKVTHKGSRESNTVTITTKEGQTSCTSDHKWMTYPLKYIETKDFKPNQRKWDCRLKFVGESYFHIETDEYKKGWLAGVFDGDGSIEVYEYPRKIWNGTRVCYRTTLSSTDKEIIDRVHSYIFDIFSEDWKIVKNKIYKETHSQSYTIYKYSQDTYIKLKKLAYDFDMRNMSYEFLRGYLGGVFDAEGSYSDNYHACFACKTDKRLRDRIKYALKKLDFKFTDRVGGNARIVNILGGQSEIIRFFSMTNPVLERKKLKLLDRRHEGINEDTGRIISIEHKSNSEKVYSIATTTHNYVADGFISKNCFPDKSENLDEIKPGMPYMCLVYDRPNEYNDAGELIKEGREAFAKIICEENRAKIFVPPNRLPVMVWTETSGKVRNKVPVANSYGERMMDLINMAEKMGLPLVEIVFRKNQNLVN